MPTQVGFETHGDTLTVTSGRHVLHDRREDIVLTREQPPTGEERDPVRFKWLALTLWVLAAAYDTTIVFPTASAQIKIQLPVKNRELFVQQVRKLLTDGMTYAGYPSESA